MDKTIRQTRQMWLPTEKKVKQTLDLATETIGQLIQTIGEGCAVLIFNGILPSCKADNVLSA